MSVQGVALSFCFIVLVLPPRQGGTFACPYPLQWVPWGGDVPGGSSRSCPPCYKKWKVEN